MTIKIPKTWDSFWDAILSPKLKAHWRWYERGRTGEGRIVISDENLQGASVRSLRGARFERCDFSGATLSSMADTELVGCIFDEANLLRSSWQRSNIVDCRFHGAWLGLANFESAQIRGGDWLGAYLESSFWTDAVVHDISFRSAMLVDCQFDRARFVDCDFRCANLSRKLVDADFARCPGTHFESCDFRNANFEGLRFNNTSLSGCLFMDMNGKPDLEGPCNLINPDFSSLGNGRADSQGVPGIRDPDEVLRVWREADSLQINHWSRYGNLRGYDPKKHYPERQD